MTEKEGKGEREGTSLPPHNWIATHWNLHKMWCPDCGNPVYTVSGPDGKWILTEWLEKEGITENGEVVLNCFWGTRISQDEERKRRQSGEEDTT